MSLFIGNIANDVDPGEFEEIFTKIGSCQVRLKVQSHPPLSSCREPSVSSTSTRKSTLRRPSLTSMVTMLGAARFESAGARRAAEVATAVEAAAGAARAASTVARTVTCPETALSLGRAAVAVEEETASTAASLGTCLATARNPRSQESLAVVVAVAGAAHASIVDRTDTCRVSARSQGSPESQGGPAADLLAEMTAESVSLVA